MTPRADTSFQRGFVAGERYGAKVEREECAKIVDEAEKLYEAAEAIRARGDKA